MVPNLLRNRKTEVAAVETKEPEETAPEDDLVQNQFDVAVRCFLFLQNALVQILRLWTGHSCRSTGRSKFAAIQCKDF
jgi:hypothetical protein